MTSNMAATLAWLRERGFVVGRAPLDCGHAPTPSGSGTGYARTPEGKQICYACADERTRADMRTADRIVLYLNGDRVATWSGGTAGRVTSRTVRKMRTPNSHWTHTRIFVRVVDLDGKHWHGSSPGDGMYVRLRAIRSQPQNTATSDE